MLIPFAEQLLKLQGSLQKLWQKIADVSCQSNHFSIAIQLQHLQPYNCEVLADLWTFSRSSMIVRRLWQLFVGSLAMWTSQTISMKDQLGFVLSVAQILEYVAEYYIIYYTVVNIFNRPGRILGFGSLFHSSHVSELRLKTGEVRSLKVLERDRKAQCWVHSLSISL